jgi:hypothetical protein
MQSQVKKFVLVVSVAGMLSMTAPAMAAPRTGGAVPEFFARIKNMIVHILDIVEVKTSLPPG